MTDRPFPFAWVCLETVVGLIISPERFTVNVSKFPMIVESACKNTDFFFYCLFFSSFAQMKPGERALLSEDGRAWRADSC